MFKCIFISLLMLLQIHASAQTLSQKPSQLPVPKSEIIDLYNKLYRSGDIDSIVWNGDEKKCKCGSLQESVYQNAQNRINFFRLVNHLNEVKINKAFNEEAQHAALLSKANNQLSHTPDKTMKCFSEAAANGCKKSCLSISDWKYFPLTSFITGFVYDYGESNYFVGHRRWLLYSRLTEFGYGATNTSEAVLTVDGVGPAPEYLPDFVAYPWSGFVPINLIFPKWSFSIPEGKKVDFSKATVSMKDNLGAAIACQKLKEYNEYLDPTMVWNTTGLFTTEEITYLQNNLEKKGFLNKKIIVQIKNVVVDGKVMNYEYVVEPIKVDGK